MGSEGSEGAVSESGIQVTSPQLLISDPWFRRPFDISLHFPYNTIIMEGCPSG